MTIKEAQKHLEALPILIEYAKAMKSSPHAEVREAACKALADWDAHR